MSTVSLGRAFAVVALLVATGPAWAQQVTQGSQGAQGTLQGFSVVLVLGDLQSGAAPDNIPAAARSALGDLKDFLPYKSYRVLDTAWILGSTSQLFRATSRLSGAEDQTYEVSLTTNPVGSSAPSLQVKFVMRDSNGDPQKAADAARQKTETLRLVAARAALEKSLQSSDSSELPEERRQRQRAVREKIRELQLTIDTMQNVPSVSDGQTLIDTSFNMRIGETVVVGTSRVRGDKALIALLTAVRK